MSCCDWEEGPRIHRRDCPSYGDIDETKEIDNEFRRADFLTAVEAEVEQAYLKHGDAQWGRHEAYGIIKEEFDEFWLAIKDDEPQERVYAELIQVAAMCLRYYETRDRYREPA